MGTEKITFPLERFKYRYGFYVSNNPPIAHEHT